MSADRTAQRAPINEWLPLLLIGFIVAVAWSAPTVSSALWSSTDWRAGRDLTTLIDAYANLFHPERIDGSGLQGRWFGVTTIAVAVTILLGVSALVGRLYRRRRHAERGLAHGADLDRFSRRAVVQGSAQILGHRDTDPKRSGLLVGRDVQSRREVWLPKESTILVLAPPRSGKTSGTVAPAVVDHYGPVVATGVRRDIMLWTHPWRAVTGAPDVAVRADAAARHRTPGRGRAGALVAAGRLRLAAHRQAARRGLVRRRPRRRAQRPVLARRRPNPARRLPDGRRPPGRLDP